MFPSQTRWMDVTKCTYFPPLLSLNVSEFSDFWMPTDATHNLKVDSEEQGGYLVELVGDSDQLLYRRHGSLTRRKRNILFPSGVKLCTQETFDQAVANHLSYFHLRGTLALPGVGFPLAYWFSFLSLRVCQNFPFLTFFPSIHGISLKLLSKLTYKLKLQVSCH